MCAALYSEITFLRLLFSLLRSDHFKVTPSNTFLTCQNTSPLTELHLECVLSCDQIQLKRELMFFLFEKGSHKHEIDSTNVSVHSQMLNHTQNLSPGYPSGGFKAMCCALLAIGTGEKQKMLP